MMKFAGYLPEAMVTDILIRLPVKSLLRCKSVCKSWLSIISNPYLVKSHLECAMNKATLLKIQYPPPYEDNNPLDVSTLAMLSSYPMHYEYHVMPELLKYFCRVVDSCNGIICLYNDYPFHHDICLWNPSIRRYKRVPSHRPSRSRKHPFKMGFGYDSSSNDYKIFRIAGENCYDEAPMLQLYSTNANIWRDIEAPILEKKVWKITTSIVVKGVMYLDGRDELISFDMHREVFGLIPFPCSVKRKMSHVLNFEDFVAMVFASVGSTTGIDLWTLDDVCNEVSWTKRFSIEADLYADIAFTCYLGAGLFYGKDNATGCGFLYDSDEKKETKYFVVWKLGDSLTLKYTKSLVSLDGFEQIE